MVRNVFRSMVMYFPEWRGLHSKEWNMWPIWPSRSDGSVIVNKHVSSNLLAHVN